jgi:hypothetical protein
MPLRRETHNMAMERVAHNRANRIAKIKLERKSNPWRGFSAETFCASGGWDGEVFADVRLRRDGCDQYEMRARVIVAEFRRSVLETSLNLQNVAESFSANICDASRRGDLNATLLRSKSF